MPTSSSIRSAERQREGGQGKRLILVLIVLAVLIGLGFLLLLLDNITGGRPRRAWRNLFGLAEFWVQRDDDPEHDPPKDDQSDDGRHDDQGDLHGQRNLASLARRSRATASVLEVSSFGRKATSGRRR
jgi:hypothetical protein